MKKLVVCLIAVSGAATFAGEIVWRGGGSTPAWSDGSNWEGGNAPGANDTVVIPSGKHAYMSSADVETASAAPLAGISLAAADSELFITNSTAVSLSVPLSGAGQLKISNGMKTLTLAADNGNLTGPVTITNSSVWSDSTHGNFLGSGNVVTNYMGSGESEIYFMRNGHYYNAFHIIGNGSSSPGLSKHALVVYASITIHGKVHVSGAFNINAPQSSGKLSLVGGVEHEGYGGLSFAGSGNYEITGNEPIVSLSSSDYMSGINFESATKELVSSPVKNCGYRTSSGIAIYSRIGSCGLFTCGAENIFNGGIALQQGALVGGGAQRGPGFRLNLNGYNQACGTIYRSSNRLLDQSTCYVTSSVPATLTMRGQWEYYGNNPGGTDKTPMAFLDRASFEFWPTNFIRTGQSLAIKPKIWFTNTTWTTKGELACRRGTLTLDADVQMPNLGNMTISHEGRIVVKAGAVVNPDRFCLSITNVQTTTASTYSVPLTIESGVLLKADRAFVGSKWLDKGTYGGQDALDAGLIDVSHVLPELGGSGVLSVKRYGVAGFTLIVF